MVNDAAFAAALRSDIAIVILKTNSWITTSNRATPGIGPATWEKLTFEPKASGYGFEVVKEKCRLTVDVTITRGDERLPFGHLAASIEACLNKVYDGPVRICAAACVMYQSTDPELAMQQATTESGAYLARRFYHLDTGKHSDIHTFLCAVIKLGYDGITRIARKRPLDAQSLELSRE